jgi:hypothetical protein
MQKQGNFRRHAPDKLRNYLFSPTILFSTCNILTSVVNKRGSILQRTNVHRSNFTGKYTTYILFKLRADTGTEKIVS